MSYTLCLLLQERQAEALKDGLIGTLVVDAPDIEERIQLMMAQHVALRGLAQLASMRGVAFTADSLKDAVPLAFEGGLITEKEQGILLTLNRKANQAKHNLDSLAMPGRSSSSQDAQGVSEGSQIHDLTWSRSRSRSRSDPRLESID